MRLQLYSQAMDQLAEASFSAYRHLVYETPEFLPYFRAATPISEIAQLNIGSRPAARTSECMRDTMCTDQGRGIIACLLASCLHI